MAPICPKMLFQQQVSSHYMAEHGFKKSEHCVWFPVLVLFLFFIIETYFKVYAKQGSQPQAQLLKTILTSLNSLSQKSFLHHQCEITGQIRGGNKFNFYTFKTCVSIHADTGSGVKYLKCFNLRVLSAVLQVLGMLCHRGLRLHAK